MTELRVVPISQQNYVCRNVQYANVSVNILFLAMRLLSRAELVVAHDTVNRDDWPRNWGADERIKGGKLYTDTSAGRTTIIQGNLDTTGEIFAKAVSIFESGETNKFQKLYNSMNDGWGSHVREAFKTRPKGLLDPNEVLYPRYHYSIFNQKSELNI